MTGLGSLTDEDIDLLAFTLPKKHKPGTDLISKLVLKDKRIMEIIITTLVGKNMHHNYLLGDCEWPNNTKSDVLYVSNLESEFLPPILIEIQHTVDMNFLERAIMYCLSVKKTYKMAPILLIICVNQVSGKELASKFNTSDTLPFMQEMTSDIWGRQCLMLSSNSIEGHLVDHPLNPMVALAIFFTRQKQSLLGLRERKDSIIQLLYSLAQEKLEGHCNAEDEKTGVILDIVDQMQKQLHKIINCLNNPLSNGKVQYYAEDAITYLNTCKRKYSTAFAENEAIIMPMSSPKPLQFNSTSERVQR